MEPTPLGLSMPSANGEDTAQLVPLLREIVESIDLYLTPQRATVIPNDGTNPTPFGGVLFLVKVGSVVTMAGGVTRSGAPAAGSVQIGTLPAGWAPQSEVGSMIGSVYGAAGEYQILVRGDGAIRFRHSAATGNTLNVNMSWSTA